MIYEDILSNFTCGSKDGYSATNLQKAFQQAGF